MLKTVSNITVYQQLKKQLQCDHCFSQPVATVKTLTGRRQKSSRRKVYANFPFRSAYLPKSLLCFELHDSILDNPIGFEIYLLQTVQVKNFL